MLTAAAACTAGLVLRLMPASTAGELLIRISYEGRSEGLSLIQAAVYTCEQIRERSAGQAIPGEIIRSTVREDGVFSIQSVSPLQRPGCYFVQVHATVPTGLRAGGVMGVSIDPTGEVREMSRWERERSIARQ